ncbi:MAG TPA: beta-propeller fold lactonase family protein [Terriglobia bacterium]|nr:beta-propeller fold lactonase family protein [Terriglobia bacterium]
MPMLKSMRSCVWIFALLVVFSTSLYAQNFVYTNNDLASANANSVSAYSVDTNGDLSPIPGSPFATNGTGNGGGLSSASRIVVAGNFLYASNAASNNVSAFTVDTGTGVLTAVSGTPFPTNAFDDPSNSGISLAATPGGNFLYAGSTGFGGQISIFSINSATGALTMLGSPIFAGGAVSGLKVSPDGKFLAVALSQLGQIAVFAIQSDGSLQAVANSPFTLTSGSATGVDINCASNLLYAGGPSGNIYAFNIASDGQLTAVTGSPFGTGHASNQVVTLSTDDKTLFSSNQGDNTVTAFAVDSTGGLTLPGTSVNAAGTAGVDTLPGGLSVSNDGTLLFAADTFSAVSSFVLGGSSPLIFGTLTSTISPLHSLAAFPAKACSSGSTSAGLSATLQILAGPPPGFDLEATLSLDSSIVVNPLTQVVNIQIGTLSTSLPAGSFKFAQNGKNSGSYVFQGTLSNTNLKVLIRPLGQNQFQISVFGKQIDLSGLPTPIAVTVGIGGNSASASVMPISGPQRLNSPVK